MKIVPIILETTVENFNRTLLKIAPLVDRINIDISDDIVTKNKTISLAEALTQLVSHPELVENKKLDFDLMVKDWRPLIDLLDQQKDLNINSVVVHQKYFQKIPLLEFDFGLALDLTDQINLKLVNKVFVIQIMTIDLGFQGSPFHPEALTKITELRTNGYEGQIIIDGGVNDQTLPLILQNKGLPDIIGVGSYLTRSDNPAENLRKLQSILTEYEV